MSDIKIKFNNETIETLKEKAQLYLATIAENVRIEAKSIVPIKTGKLRDSIEVFDGETKNEKYIGTKTTTYSLFVELGTIKMDPHPYLRPALDTIVGGL